MSTNGSRINPNRADVDELTQLPGIGPSLAERIIANAPYGSVEELRRVPGLGAMRVEQLRGHVDFNEQGQTIEEAHAEPVIQAKKAEQAGQSETRDESARRQPQEAAPAQAKREGPGSAPAPRLSSRKWITRSQALQLVAATGAVSILLSIVIVLAIIAGINGTLDVSSNQTVRQLGADIATIETGLAQTDLRLQGLVVRLESLEGLTGRVAGVENQITGISGDLEQVSVQVGMIRTQVEELERVAEEFRRSSRRFDAFLEGLGRLLGGILEDTGARPDAGVAPTPVPTQ